MKYFCFVRTDTCEEISLGVVSGESLEEVFSKCLMKGDEGWGNAEFQNVKDKESAEKYVEEWKEYARRDRNRHPEYYDLTESIFRADDKFDRLRMYTIDNYNSGAICVIPVEEIKRFAEEL